MTPGTDRLWKQGGHVPGVGIQGVEVEVAVLLTHGPAGDYQQLGSIPPPPPWHNRTILKSPQSRGLLSYIQEKLVWFLFGHDNAALGLVSLTCLSKSRDKERPWGSIPAAHELISVEDVLLERSRAGSLVISLPPPHKAKESTTGY